VRGRQGDGIVIGTDNEEGGGKLGSKGNWSRGNGVATRTGSGEGGGKMESKDIGDGVSRVETMAQQ
jgi:hypothetical protein